MRILENCKPERVFYYFEEIAKIPHGSRNTKAISDYLAAFAKEHGLSCIQDPLNNIIIQKPASAGYEHAEPVILQGHMDMVCEKEPDVSIDFEKDSLSLVADGDFIRADGTTLGGDDGIAVAYALALLEDRSLSHPALEVVLTTDEEIGMTGAYGMDLSMLKGRKMLNIDSEEEGHFLTSCAGGMSLRMSIPVERESIAGLCVTIRITGLLGGHSGAEIHKERANAAILMGRVLEAVSRRLNGNYRIISISGGCKDNAIPRECIARVLTVKTMESQIIDEISTMQKMLRQEYELSDPGLCVRFAVTGETYAEVLTADSALRVLRFLRLMPNGVQNYSMVMPGLVETSLNLGILELKEKELHAVSSIRSSVASRKTELMERVLSLVSLLGGSAESEGDYPAWEYRKDSPLREEISAVYRDLFGKEPVFEAIHAGLECGIFADRLPGLDCVSFGPDLFDIHTPKERLSISSAARTWEFILAFLERCR